MALSTLIVDSDSSTRELVSRWISASRHLTLGGEAEGLKHGLAILERSTPCAVLCAIELSDGSGFDILRCLPASSQVVFLALSATHAAHAFEVNACDYLVKPLSLERFQKAEERLVMRGLARTQSQGRGDSGVLIEAGVSKEFVALGDVVAIVSVGGNYTEVHRVVGPSLEARRTMKGWEQVLPSDRFVRTHRSTLVNLEHVQALERHGNGDRTLRVRTSESRFPVSRRLAPSLAHALEAMHRPAPLKR